jgi:thiol-disulfide isomerase/thioredoxin
MKILGLFIVLGLALAGGALYVSSTTFKTQEVPQSYQVLDDLENKGIYQGEEIKLKNLEGQVLQLSDYKGKIVILSFWATWCEPCVEEFPSFLKLLDEFPEKVILIAISHDESEQDVREFVGAFKGFRNNMILTMDENKALSRAFGVDKRRFYL